MVKVQIQKKHSLAKIPEFANSGDAGMDLFSVEALTINPGKRVMINTGISLAFPHGYAALIWDKSGVAVNGVTTLAGVIDSEYRGEYKVILLNVGTEPYEIKVGQKIAQVLIQPVAIPEVEEVEHLDTNTSRGEGGFGSTGLH